MPLTPPPAPRQRRQPRFHTRLRQETRERIAQQRALAAGDARAAGPPGP
jgi:hypothetical protein